MNNDFFNNSPYAVEIFVNGNCTDSFRTNELTNAQAKLDSWENDLAGEKGIEIKMFKYNNDLDIHEQIDYNGNLIEELN